MRKWAASCGAGLSGHPPPPSPLLPHRPCSAGPACWHSDPLAAPWMESQSSPECPTSHPSAGSLPGQGRAGHRFPALEAVLRPAPQTACLGILTPGHTLPLTLQACLVGGCTPCRGKMTSSSHNSLHSDYHSIQSNQTHEQIRLDSELRRKNQAME